MANELLGESKSESGFAMAHYTTAERLAFTPENIGTLVYDTELKRQFSWDVGGWSTLLAEEDLDVLKQSSFLTVFNGVSPNTTEIFKFLMNKKTNFLTADNALNITHLNTAPVGGDAVWEVYKDSTVVATVTHTVGQTESNVVWSSDVTFNVGDKFSIRTASLNDASDLSINFYGYRVTE